MKKIFTYLSTLILAAACAPQLEIEYSHEEQAFETREDRILVEAILPQATAAGDEVYIIGAFNGNDAAIGNSAYKLTRSEVNTAKWGVYVDPAAFLDGKTLADGFTFYNKKQGYERSSKNEPVLHTLTIGQGQWANVYADKWEAYFDPESFEGGGEEGGVELPAHDGVRIYIIDKTGWDEIALYQWGDVNDFGGGWPGAQVAGTVTIEGQEYKYFEYGDDIIGLGQNLIFNNNGGGTQLADVGITFEEGVPDYFFLVTEEGATRQDGPGGGISIPEHSGIRVWVNDQTGWDEIALYQWGDVNDFGGAWPGSQVAGTADLGGITFKYFEYGDDIIGLGQNLIFNNNGAGTQLADVGVTFEDGVKDYFFVATPDGATLLDGPDGGSGETEVIEEENGPRIYIKNDIFSDWGNDIAAYYWEKPLSSKDPGSTFERTSVVIEEGAYPETFWVASGRESKRGQAITLNIFPKADAPFFYKESERPAEGEPRVATISTVMDTDRYFVLKYNDSGAPILEEIDMGVHLFVDNKTFWPGELYAHAWTDGEESLSTEWPGVTSVPGYDDEQNEYSTFFLPKEFRGKTGEVIFHSDVDDSNNRFQVAMTFEDGLFYTLSREISIDPVEKAPVTLHVIDQTGWDALTVYLWGDKNNLGGGWPGIQVSGTETVGKVTLKEFVVPDALGRNENLIFNNNGGGTQLADFNITFEQTDYYLLVTAEGVEVTEAPTGAIYKTTFFVNDQTGWDEIALYQWGEVNNLGGGWPGAQVSGTVTIGDTDYKVIVVEDGEGLNQNLIFNNNGHDVQLGDYALKLDKPQYFLTVTDSGVTLEEEPATVVFFVEDQTGWEGLALYQWGEVNNLGGGWPGAPVATTATIGEKACKVFVVDEAKGLSQNLIFNNNGAGTQLGDYALTLNNNAYYLSIDSTGVYPF